MFVGFRCKLMGLEHRGQPRADQATGTRQTTRSWLVEELAANESTGRRSASNAIALD